MSCGKWVGCGDLSSPAKDQTCAQWKHGVLTTGPPGNLSFCTFKSDFPLLCNVLVLFKFIKENPGDFPGGAVVGTLPSNAGSVGSIPGERAKIPHTSRPKNHDIKENQCCNKFNKDLKKKKNFEMYLWICDYI